MPTKYDHAGVRAELQALIGKPLDAEQAERLEDRLKVGFPDYNVARRTDARKPARPGSSSSSS